MSKIEEYRIMKGLTQTELANVVGCTQIDISRYENGTHVPQVGRLKAIADALDVRMEDLI